MTTLAEFMILSGADNRPPMLDKALYVSWQSRMELYMMNREHGRMILVGNYRFDETKEQKNETKGIKSSTMEFYKDGGF
ncbi:hypothetical protein Tco_1012140 [Tanacetum coccineum]